MSAENTFPRGWFIVAWANELDPRRRQHGFLTLQAMRKWN